MKCKNCVRHVHLNDDGERTPGTPNWCFYLNDSPDEDIERDCAAFKPITNYDRIVSQTPEELANWIAGSVLNLTGGSLEMATEAWRDWLKQETWE